MRIVLIAAVGAVVAITTPAAQHSPKNLSDIPVDLMYVETADGLYTPIGLRRPPGKGPFPIVLFAHASSSTTARSSTTTSSRSSSSSRRCRPSIRTGSATWVSATAARR